MSDFLIDAYIAIEMVVFVYVFALGVLAITLSECVYDIENVLTDPNEFIKCVFQWQYVILGLSDYVKPSGIAFLIVTSAIFLLPFNAMVFVFLTVLEFIRLLIRIFMKVFGKEV